DRAGIAKSWGQLGSIQRNRGNWDEAERLYRQCLEVETELGDRSGMATSWGLLGDIQRNRGNWDEAERLYRQSLELRTELGDRSGMATSWGLLGDIQRNRGNWDEAERLYRQSLELRTELGDRKGMASSWGLLGDIQRNRGNWDEAERLYQQSLDLRTELGDRSGMASSWGQLGDIQRNRGNWDEAERLYRQYLELSTELGDKSGMAKSWGILGDIQRFRGKWDEAECLYRQSLQLRTELGDRSGMASSWEQLGYIQNVRGNWDEAERLFRQSLELRTELGDSPEERLRQRSGMAATWASLGYIQRKRGNWDEAERLYRQSLDLRTELGDRSGMATSWGQLGDIERNRGNWEEAERLYQQSLDLRTELGNKSGMAEFWGVLGDIEGKRGNWDEAERLFRQCLEVETELGNKSGMAEFWGVLGSTEQLRGKWDEAECLYRQSLEVYTELGDKSGMAESWGLLGSIERNRGKWDEAERLFRQSLDVYTELGDRSSMASSWGDLEDIERKRGNWDEAERLYRQCLEVETELGDSPEERLFQRFDPQCFDMLTTWVNLGSIELYRGNWDEAERLYRQCLEVYTKLGSRLIVAIVWGVLGYIEKKRGNWDEAERLYRQCLEVETELGDRWGMGTSYNKLARLHQHLNEIPEAIAAWREGLAICPPERFPLEALDIGRNLGDTGFDIQDWETAIEGYEAAIEAVETRCSFTDSYTEKQKRREAALETYEKLVQACIHAGDIGKALASVERSKSRNLIELLTNRELYPSGDVPPELLEQLDSLRREVTAKQRLLESLDKPTHYHDRGAGDIGQRSSTSSSFTPDAIETLREEYQKAQQALNQLLDILTTYDPNFTLTQRVKTIQFSQIQALLDKETVLVEWYLTRERIYTFIVTGEQGEISVHISTPEQFRELQELRQSYLESYSRDFSHWETHLGEFLRRLRDILDLPQLLAKLSPNYQRLILVPYRDLHLFPLHALPLGDGEPEYLADRFPQGVTYSPSCQFLQVSQRNRKTPSQKRLFAIQNPTEDLDYADLEVEAILAKFPPNTRYLARTDASKTALNQDPHRQYFQGADYLHFAGHGAFNFNSPLLSPLVLAGAKVPVSSPEPAPVPPRENASPATATTRFLPWRKGTQIDLTQCYTLGELFELHLPACRLVILSACETGLTDFSPELEEYISLGLGFLYAGATNVICSLWAVNDVSTAILMVKFYEEMETQPSVALALKQAQQWMRTVTKQELTAWMNDHSFGPIPHPKAKLRERLNLGFKRPDYRPYQHPIHWAAFCAIGV
ncbi:MAG: CHAT domain-containing protein, partial [Arthrospira sp. SH-MAG29]